MLYEYPLHVQNMIDYAKKWALSRNPAYYDFEEIGGDCTNFISQCLYAGGAMMNYTRDVGWYYVSQYDRAAAWTSVAYLHQFLLRNQSVGPFGAEIPLDHAAAGDVLQLGTGAFHHSMLIIGIRGGTPYIAAHSNDALDVPLTAYVYDQVRCLRIQGRKYR